MAENGRYSLESLPHRYGDAKLPEVIIADMNEQLSTGNTTAFSNELIQALEENLERKEQDVYKRQPWQPWLTGVSFWQS